MRPKIQQMGRVDTGGVLNKAGTQHKQNRQQLHGTTTVGTTTTFDCRNTTRFACRRTRRALRHNVILEKGDMLVNSPVWWGCYAPRPSPQTAGCSKSHHLTLSCS